MRFRCKNGEEEGCIVVASAPILLEHERTCTLGIERCPLRQRTIKCDWAGCIKDLPTHCKENHPNHFVSATLQDYSFSNFAAMMNTDKRLESIYIAFNKVFKVVVDVDSVRGLMRWCAILLHKYRDGYEYNYCFKIKSQNDEELLSHISKCPQRGDLEYGYCALPLRALLEDYCVDGDLKFTINIKRTVPTSRNNCTHKKNVGAFYVSLGPCLASYPI